MRKNTNGDFIVLNNKLTGIQFEASKVKLQSKNVFDETKLEYFKDIYNELKPDQRGKALYLLTVFPEFEKFYKAGLKSVCQRYINIDQNISWKTFL
jgi:hypothetical protein